MRDLRLLLLLPLCAALRTSRLRSVRVFARDKSLMVAAEPLSPLDQLLSAVNASASWSFAPNLTYANDYLSVTGRVDALTHLSCAWPGVVRGDAQFRVLRVAARDEHAAVAQWNFTFVPLPVQALVAAAALWPGGCTVSFFDLLDQERVVTVFSWAALRRFCLRLLTRAEMLLPHAVVLGTCEVTWRPAADGAREVVAVKESLALFRAIVSGRLRNRRLATDLLEFLDARRPPAVDVNAWSDAIDRRLPYSRVPGLRPLDVDGLDADAQARLLSASSRIIGAATLVVLAFGVCAATVVFNQLWVVPSFAPTDFD